ncbi:carbonic anhydrase family protein [Urechidicola vernalis]|uniref:Carbonic anhydrase family protein n=1 Tax=Urechidicola vernalis TaxID=3075600 RepID=A0ABU2Y2E7_9FLAO|nr:carbonic anhydrase family protein [Urechidicola sp. P050]MDT0551955.1 carbonic anhydrase family protein [Urechidicola sp. P050]
MKAQTKESQDKLNGAAAIQLLKDGNERFAASTKAERNLLEQVGDTSGGQFPFAAVLSCIDSRVPAEIVFDQGIGDIFSARVAGNIINEDILGSIEYACKVAGSKAIVVLGHSKCGAVTAACKGVELGNITALLSKIQPAVNEIKPTVDEFTPEAIETVSETNVKHSIENIRKESPILAEMESNGEIEIVGAIYHVESGQVTWL